MPPLIDPFAKAERPSATGLVDPFESGTPGTREAPEPAGFWANMKTLAGESYTQATANLGALMAAGQWDNLDEDQQTAISEKMAEANKQYDKPEELDAYMEKIGDEAQDVGDAWDKGEYGKAALQAMDFLGETVMEGIRNPKGFAYMNAEQAANLAATWAPGIALGKAGAVAGSVASPAGAAVGGGGGFIVGAGLGSFAIETGAQIREFIQEQGGNPEDPEAQRAALADPDMRKQLLTNASKKGLPIAVFDAVANLMGIKLLKGITGPLSAVKRSTGALGAQVGGAGGGEAAGQKWATGKIDWPDLGAEVALEIGPGGLAEPGLGAWAARNKPGDKPTPESNATLNAQLDAFSSDRKRAVLFTPGETLPEELPLNSTMETLDSGEGTLVYWQDDPEALELANNGRLGTVLGYGLDEKPKGSDQVVTARDEQGRVIQDVVTDGSPEVEMAAYTVAGEGGSVETRPAVEALDERRTERKKEAERTRSAQAKDLTQQFAEGTLDADTLAKNMAELYGSPEAELPDNANNSSLGASDQATNLSPTSAIKKQVSDSGPVNKVAPGGLNTFLSESMGDSGTGNVKTVANLAKTKTFRTQGLSGFDIPTQRVVVERMLASLHDFKVRQAVIKAIPVDVMDDLAGKQVTPKMLLHDESMLKDILSSDLKNPVPLAIDTASIVMGGIAASRTKKIGVSSKPARRDLEGGVTKGTIDNKHAVTPISDVVTGAGEVSAPSAPPILPEGAKPGQKSAIGKKAKPASKVVNKKAKVDNNQVATEGALNGEATETVPAGAETGRKSAIGNGKKKPKQEKPAQEVKDHIGHPSAADYAEQAVRVNAEVAKPAPAEKPKVVAKPEVAKPAKVAKPKLVEKPAPEKPPVSKAKPKPLLKSKPKALSKIILSTEAIIEETGDTILIEQNAAVALRQADKRINTLRSLLNCLT